jgi:hypothetical protein
MITNWVAPKAGATVFELYCYFHEWPKYVSMEHRYSAKTNLSINPRGLVEDYDLQRLHSENLEVEP